MNVTPVMTREGSTRGRVECTLPLPLTHHQLHPPVVECLVGQVQPSVNTKLCIYTLKTSLKTSLGICIDWYGELTGGEGVSGVLAWDPA